jgi:hypothetical protein
MRDTQFHISLKQQLLQLCLEAQTQRVAHARSAMDEAQQAANQEGRSTAGDKYDTSRAMSQNLRDMNARQMQEALKDLALLQQLNTDILFTQVKPGSVANTSNGNYFIAISGGPYKVEGTSYFSVSAASPIGELLLNKVKGDTFLFRGKTVTITDVF